MFDISHSEIRDIDLGLEAMLGLAKDRSAEAEQLALDAARLLSCTESRLQDYLGQGFFKRCWYVLARKTRALETTTQADLIDMQKYAWRYINLLQERDLMLAHSMIAVKNNLMTLAIGQDDLKREVTRLAGRVYDRFVALEGRVGVLEDSHRVHSWLLTIDTLGYDDAYPEHLRLLRVIHDFYLLKSSSWNVLDLKFLEKALKSVGIDTRKNIGVSQFIGGIIDEVNSRGYDEFCSLVPPCPDDGMRNGFIIDAVSSPAFSALYQIKDNYTSSSRVIRSLQRRLELSHADAIKFVLTDFIDETGIETGAELPLKDLATEILGCFSLAQRLSTERPVGQPENPSEPIVAALPLEEPGVILEEPEVISPAEARLAAVREYLDAQPPVKNLHRMGNIPENKRHNAVISMAIPASEAVFALIDATSFGSSTEGVAICTGGIFWKNWLSKPGRVSWEDIYYYKDAIVIKNDSELELWNKGSIKLARSAISAPLLKEMLFDLSGRFQKLT